MSMERRNGHEPGSGSRGPDRRRWQTLAAAAAGAAVLAGLVLAGCSLFVPKLQTPQLSIVSVAIERSDLMTQHLKVHVRVDNPNDRALPVKGLSYTLYIAGDEAARGVSDASFTVPALGEAEFDMDVTANIAGTLFRMFAHGGTDSIDYRIAGRVDLSHGLLRSIPFEQHGTFSLR